MTTFLEVESALWVSNARSLLAAGFVRCEWLTATHNGESSFTVSLCVSREDLSERTIVSSLVTSSIESLISVYPHIAFQEREVAQMFGLVISGHDTSELAFATQFDGFPMRRDFALISRMRTEWPGAVEPDENARRRPALPPGVFPEWQS
jgi:NADH:ubiquinone oxidoreductase subunit C